MKKTVDLYPMDNSGIIHLAAMRKNYTNSFRITITLKETVCKEKLQGALNYITPRFPTIIAGIHKGIFQYKIKPVEELLEVHSECVCLAPMGEEKIRNCAFRVLYKKNQIIGEFFHSLTDGYGGLIVMNTLVAEYLRRQYSVSVAESEMIADVCKCVPEEELMDDYFTYAGKRAATPKHANTYQLSGFKPYNYSVLTTTKTYTTDEILGAAHRYGVSATTFLTAVMVASIMEIQQENLESHSLGKTVQVMVPINLRKLFPSRTLHNFSLFALCGVEPQEKDLSFDELIHKIGCQLSSQNSKEHMSAALATNTKAASFPLYRGMPLALKCALLRLTHQLYGENNSCISLSNLGVISLPDNMSEYVTNISLALTPRIKSSYNCGVASINGKMSITFSRLYLKPQLENIFFHRLEQVIAI